MIISKIQKYTPNNFKIHIIQKLAGLNFSNADNNSENNTKILNKKTDNVGGLLKSMKVNGNPGLNLAKPIKSKKVLKEAQSNLDIDLDPSLQSAAQNIVQALPNIHQNKVRDELLTKLREESHLSDSRKTTFDISSIFAGMKIDDTPPKRPNFRNRPKTPVGSGSEEPSSRADGPPPYNEKSRSFQSEGLLENDGNGGDTFNGDRLNAFKYESLGDLRQKIDLVGGQALGIFPPSTKDNPGVAETRSPLVVVGGASDALCSWDRLERRELLNYARQPPTNPFQELIQMTEQGKIWRFPIDNEYGLEEEARVPFYDHVFVSNYVEERTKDYPADDVLNSIPIKHFLELVAVGLSKNPYYTVQEKRDSIDWYIKYFKENECIIRASYDESIHQTPGSPPDPDQAELAAFN